jgi:hypothetical protein
MLANHRHRRLRARRERPPPPGFRAGCIAGRPSGATPGRLPFPMRSRVGDDLLKKRPEQGDAAGHKK